MNMQPPDVRAALAPARRAVGKRGMVASAHPLATQAGHDVLAAGGNAIDAAVATAAVLGVVQPMMSGLGGDTFVLARCGRTGQIRSINASGPSPRAQSLEWARNAGLAALPDRGFLSASVPGAVAGMCTAHRLLGSGKIGLRDLLGPSIRHAAEGVALSPSVARFFAHNVDLLRASASASRQYLDDGQVPLEGHMLRQPDLARTLDAIGMDGAEAFYRGEFAQRLIRCSASAGGLFALADLADYQCDVVEPISLTLNERTIYTNPPVGQGVVLLEALGIMARCRAEPDEQLRIHRMIEALKLAFADRNRYLGDPNFIDNPIDRLLSDGHLSMRALRIDDAKALQDVAERWQPFGDGDTTCLTTADDQGNVVAYITSLSTPFGAAEVVEGTGVLMNNRAGRGFTLDPEAPNCLAAGKRTMSTLHAYIVCEPSGPVLVGGTSGGDGQPQWNLQILDAVLNQRRDILDAIDQPRWELSPGTDPINLGQPFEIRMDHRSGPSLRSYLGSIGHIISDKPIGMLGAAQLIALDAEHGLIGAADGRSDGCAMGLD